MKANHQRHIESGKEFDYLFPKAKGKEITMKWDANVWDTLKLIPKIVYENLNDTKALAKTLKANTLNETCQNIWDFVYHHIQYAPDEEGVEQIRRPARTWMDRVRGVDCDCYSVFISSILTNLSIPHTYRIAKYKNKDYFQHIYPIVPTPDGNYITIDCVVNNYNYEEPFTEKNDTPMNLTYLNGIEPQEENESLMAVSKNSDLSELPDFQDFDGLGKLNLKKTFHDIGVGVKNTLHVVNRVNPATTLLRLGVLASMKLNLFNVAKNLRYAYLTDEQAQKQNFDMSKLGMLRNILGKMEDVFYAAGGKQENLKKEILTGKGNKDHAVSGFEEEEVNGIDNYDENTPLHELLSGVFDEENGQVLNGLGEPVTAATITAASSAIATIAALIAKLGNMKKVGSKPTNADDTGNSSTDTNSDSTTNTNNNMSNNNGNNALMKQTGSEVMKTADNNTSNDNSTDTPPQSFFEKTKAWVKANPVKTVAGVVVLAGATWGLIELHKHHKAKHMALSGTHGAKKSRKKKRGKKHKQHKKNIALL